MIGDDDVMAGTDHEHVVQAQRDRFERFGLVCGGICDAPAHYLTLWHRPEHPTFCRCDQCMTSPACAEHTAIWRSNGSARVVSVCTIPAGWTPADGWPNALMSAP